MSQKYSKTENNPLMREREIAKSQVNDKKFLSPGGKTPKEHLKPINQALTDLMLVETFV